MIEIKFKNFEDFKASIKSNILYIGEPYGEIIWKYLPRGEAQDRIDTYVKLWTVAHLYEGRFIPVINSHILKVEYKDVLPGDSVKLQGQKTLEYVLEESKHWGAVSVIEATLFSNVVEGE